MNILTARSQSGEIMSDLSEGSMCHKGLTFRFASHNLKCSHEHMLPPKETRTKLQKLKFALGQIRLQVDDALEGVDGLETDLNPKFLQWRCDGCGYEKHFTKASTVVACETCPRCKGAAFSPGMR